jgi:hypothetical protein
MTDANPTVAAQERLNRVLSGESLVFVYQTQHAGEDAQNLAEWIHGADEARVSWEGPAECK